MKDLKFLSIVIPIHNEEDTIPELYRRLHAVLDTLNEFSFEIIFIDDGSTDNSMILLEDIHKKDNRVKIFQLSRNFGHHIAITAGIDFSLGDVVVLMDGDLQNRPEDIPALLEKIDEGYDVVYTIRKNRQDPLLKKIGSQLFVWFMKKAVGGTMTVNTSIFRAMRRNIVEAMGELRERNRFTTGLIEWVGFKQTSIEVLHDKRFAGKTKYPLGKQLKLALNAIFAFTTFPLQLASMFGFLITSLAFGYGIYIIIRKFLFGFSTEGFAAIITSIFFLGGVQLIILGILGAYIGRIYTEVKQRPLYVIKRKLD